MSGPVQAVEISLLGEGAGSSGPAQFANVAFTPTACSGQLASHTATFTPAHGSGPSVYALLFFIVPNRPPLLRLDQARSPLIAVLRAADMNTTADQAINLSPKRYVIRRIIVTNANASLTTAVGGLYTGPGQTGVALVPAGQSYAALTSSDKFIDTTLHASAFTDHYAVSTLYLSLTTPQGVPATADIYIYGDSVEA